MLPFYPLTDTNTNSVECLSKAGDSMFCAKCLLGSPLLTAALPSLVHSLLPNKDRDNHIVENFPL